MPCISSLLSSSTSFTIIRLPFISATTITRRVSFPRIRPTLVRSEPAVSRPFRQISPGLLGRVQWTVCNRPCQRHFLGPPAICNIPMLSTNLAKRRHRIQDDHRQHVPGPVTVSIIRPPSPCLPLPLMFKLMILDCPRRRALEQPPGDSLGVAPVFAADGLLIVADMNRALPRLST